MKNCTGETWAAHRSDACHYWMRAAPSATAPDRFML